MEITERKREKKNEKQNSQSFYQRLMNILSVQL
jgi:hypothetical protein